ncbi:hypothetical protein V12B01_16336 [Vibrio splendidus 12B01]|nr:hypothetical protein V12B01_16336 [Vibrio splendidus 12B01]
MVTLRLFLFQNHDFKTMTSELSFQSVLLFRSNEKADCGLRESAFIHFSFESLSLSTHD